MEYGNTGLTRALPSALGLAARTFVRSFRFVPNEPEVSLTPTEAGSVRGERLRLHSPRARETNDKMMNDAKEYGNTGLTRALPSALRLAHVRAPLPLRSQNRKCPSPQPRLAP